VTGDNVTVDKVTGDAVIGEVRQRNCVIGDDVKRSLSHSLFTLVLQVYVIHSL